MSEARARGWIGHLAAILLVALSGVAGRAMASDQGPFLRVETGVHEAAINGIAALPGDVGVVTVSDDKTARVWSLGSLAPVGVMRPPLGPGDVGALYATAASENSIAMGGRLWDAASGRFGVALYQRADLSAAGVLWGFPAAVTALRFSRSGRLLAVGMQGGAGVRVLDLTARKTAFHDGPFGGTVNGLDFDAQDRLAVASDDGGLRLYTPDGQAIKLPPLPKSAVPWRIAFSPDGNQLAIGDRQRPAVHLLDLRKLRFEPDLSGAPLTAGGFDVVAYAPDGKTLYAAGRYVDKSGQIYIRCFTLGPRPAATDIKATRQLVTDLLPVDDGLIVTTADPAILRLDLSGKPTASVMTGHADLRVAGVDALLISRDGTVIDLPDGNGNRVRFDASAHAIIDPDNRPVRRPFAAANGLAATQWLNSHTPQLNGNTVPLEPGETVRAVAVLPGGTGAAFGSDFYVRLEGRAGELWRVPTEAPAWAVNASGDGRLVVAALGDGTVHWYDAVSGRELLALLLDPVTRRFVMWTPDGFFDHDHRADGKPDGRGLIGYRFNKPSGRDSDFVEIGQLYPIFFRPDLVGLSLRDDAAGRRIVAEQSGLLGNVAAALAGGLPARVTLLDVCAVNADGCGQRVTFDPKSPYGGDTVALHTESDRLLIHYRLDVAADTPGPVTIKRNDAVIAGDVAVAATEPHRREETATVSLATGVNRIRLSPVSESRAVEATDAASAVFSVERDAPPPAQATPVPAGRTLYVLSVGVGEYQEPDLDILALRNAADDAAAVADLFAVPSPPVYETPKVVRLVGKDATREAIIGALRDIRANARPDDMVVIFLAGHGLSVDGHYYYAAGDLGQGDSEVIGKLLQPATEAEGEAATAALFQHDGLSQDTLLPLLQSIPASHVALFLDTCYSATAATSDAVLRRDLNATVTNRLGHATGRFVLSSAFRKAQDSGGEEMDDHGLFTAFLLRAFQGAADLGNSGMIDIYKLATYMHDNVLTLSTQMAKQRHDDAVMQEPSFYFAGNDFFKLHAVLTTARTAPPQPTPATPPSN
jgi:WD40 repeat protein